jgi:flagellar FliL protein
MTSGGLMPDFEVRFVPTVAIEADRSWSFDAREEWDEFNSPLRHPEHVVLLNKVVVNLRPSESSDGNPMGYFEFYLEANSQEAAIEIDDRQAEILDVVQRTVEAITYDEIVTPAGKNKLKLVIRKDLNQVLTKGRVRKVFYKSVVIKP